MTAYFLNTVQILGLKYTPRIQIPVCCPSTLLNLGGTNIFLMWRCVESITLMSFSIRCQQRATPGPKIHFGEQLIKLSVEEQALDVRDPWEPSFVILARQPITLNLALAFCCLCRTHPYTSFFLACTSCFVLYSPHSNTQIYVILHRLISFTFLLRCIFIKIICLLLIFCIVITRQIYANIRYSASPNFVYFSIMMYFLRLCDCHSCFVLYLLDRSTRIQVICIARFS